MVELTMSASFAAPVRTSDATFSYDRQYRYELWRRWSADQRDMVVIGLNPSTADETIDDPTIRRCIGFALREGCGALVMLNLFALRATKPVVMLAHPEPVGPDNDRTMRQHARTDSLFVAAWGAHGSHRNRAMEVQQIFTAAGARLWCLGRTAAGAPRHPLYLRNDAPLIEYAR